MLHRQGLLRHFHTGRWLDHVRRILFHFSLRISEILIQKRKVVRQQFCRPSEPERPTTKSHMTAMQSVTATTSEPAGTSLAVAEQELRNTRMKVKTVASEVNRGQLTS